MDKKAKVTKTIEKSDSKVNLFIGLCCVFVISLLLISGFVLMKKTNNSSPDSSTVSSENNTQIINLIAKTGYSPKNISAKAGIDTTLKINTKNTYDCSSSIKIPDLNFAQVLPANGTTNVEIPAQTSGTKIKGLCEMGMYSFVISFV